MMYGVKVFVVVFETHVHLMYFVFVFCNLKSICICILSNVFDPKSVNAYQ